MEDNAGDLGALRETTVPTPLDRRFLGRVNGLAGLLLQLSARHFPLLCHTGHCRTLLVAPDREDRLSSILAHARCGRVPACPAHRPSRKVAARVLSGQLVVTPRIP